MYRTHLMLPLALFVLVSCCASLWAEVVPAKITRVSGQVHVLRGGDASKEEAASEGLSLGPGDVVKTGVDSQVTIEMGAGNTVEVVANSTLKIDPTPDAPKLDLLGGKLLSRLKSIPKGKQVVVGTPTSIAGIEGTTFSVSVADNGTTNVDVLAGSVKVQSTGEPNKFAQVTDMRRVQVSAWTDTVFVATGSGVAPDRYKRPKINEGGKEILVVRASGVGMPAAGAQSAEERRASAERAAMDAALRELGDRVMRAEISQEKNVGNLTAENRETYDKVSSLVAGAAVTKREVRDDGSVEVYVELTTSALNSAVSLKTPVFASAMVQLSPEQYTQVFTPRARLTAEQAAKTVADRNLLEQIQGVLINSQTTIQDFALRDDRVTSKVDGVIRGAETVRTLYFSDGTVEMTRQVKGVNVQISINALVKKEILGTHYMGRPVDIDPMGYEALRRLGN